MAVTVKDELHRKLTAARANLVSNLDGLGEYDLRRPLTPTGTNLLGLVKHVAGLEYGYLGACVGRSAPETLPWVEDGSVADGADMWATPDESAEYVLGLYRRAAAHADDTITALDLDSPAHVPWWSQPETTLGVLLIRMLAETAQHAGHADIVRELIDGHAGNPEDQMGEDPEYWRRFTARIQAAATATLAGRGPVSEHTGAAAVDPATHNASAVSIGVDPWRGVKSDPDVFDGPDVDVAEMVYDDEE